MRIVIGVWLILSLINIIYSKLRLDIDAKIDNASKETDGLVSRNIILFFFLVMSTVVAPFLFISETLPGIKSDIKNIFRFLRYKIIIRKRKNNS